MSVEIKGGDMTEVIEVATSQLSEHSKQSEFSPMMSKKKWTQFIAGIAKKGILKPLTVTKGFRVIDGKHRLKAAKELGIESIRVIIEDIPEDDIASWITETKLNKDDLKNGQKAALVIRLHYEEERLKSKEVYRMNVGRPKKSKPDLAEIKISRDTATELAKKAGVGRSSMTYLIAVYRNRPELYERVFNGEYSINKAYTEMKRDEEPEQVPQDEPFTATAKEVIEQSLLGDQTKPQIDDSLPASAPHNRIVQMRKKALSLTAEILDETGTINKVDENVRESAREQLISLTKSCIIALGQSAKGEDDTDILALCLEMLDKINGGDE